MTTPEETWRALRLQYARAHAQAQEVYDASIRTLAGAGVAVTATFISALKEADRWALAAIVLFLTALAANLLSYATAQADLRERIRLIDDHNERAFKETRWTRGTWILNVIGGVALLCGGIMLALFVWKAA